MGSQDRGKGRGSLKTALERLGFLGQANQKGKKGQPGPHLAGEGAEAYVARNSFVPTSKKGARFGKYKGGEGGTTDPGGKRKRGKVEGLSFGKRSNKQRVKRWEREKTVAAR